MTRLPPLALGLFFFCGCGADDPPAAPTGTGGFAPGAGGAPASGGAPPGAGGVMTTAGGTGSGGGPAAGGGPTGEATGCDATPLLASADDPGVRGPWDVGVRTVQVGRTPVEITYPAQPGSTTGLPEETYDIRDWLPEGERTKVADEFVPLVGPIGGRLFRDVPIDDGHGPYPVIIMIHGTASFRIASGSINTHWSSRGFVVLAADYPGLGLADQLAATLECSLPQSGAQDVAGDVSAQIQALGNPSGDLGFLAGRVDTTRLALAGHSQGACLAAILADTPNVQVVLAMTGSSTLSASSSLKSAMWIAGINDTVIGYDTALIGNSVCPANPQPSVSNQDAYNAAPTTLTKRLVGISGGGHLVPTDLCQTNSQGRNAIEQANMDGVCGINSAVVIGLPTLFDCGTIAYEDGVHAVNYATTAALEETLLCRDRSMAFSNMTTAVPLIGDFQHSP